MKMVTPLGDITLSVTMVGFVDDATYVTSSNPAAPIGDLVKRMQHDSQLWNDLLWTSGGKLELPKCGYHTVYYIFKPDGTPILHQEKLSSDSGEVTQNHSPLIMILLKLLGNIRSQSDLHLVLQFSSLQKMLILQERIWVILNRHPSAQRSRQLKFLSKLQI